QWDSETSRNPRGFAMLVLHSIMAELIHFGSAAEFRKWLGSNHADCAELWIAFYKRTSAKRGISYPEAIDEALCFGWIDGVRKKVDADVYRVRFSPRRPKSRWSAINIKRTERLKAAGRMHKAGLAAFRGATDQTRAYSYEQRNQAKFDPALARRFQANRS